jgi:hypothetical protein
MLEDGRHMLEHGGHRLGDGGYMVGDGGCMLGDSMHKTEGNSGMREHRPVYTQHRQTHSTLVHSHFASTS